MFFLHIPLVGFYCFHPKSDPYKKCIFEGISHVPLSHRFCTFSSSLFLVDVKHLLVFQPLSRKKKRTSIKNFSAYCFPLVQGCHSEVQQRFVWVGPRGQYLPESHSAFPDTFYFLNSDQAKRFSVSFQPCRKKTDCRTHMK